MYKKFFMLCLLMTLACPAQARKVVTFQPLQAPVNPYQNAYQNNYQAANQNENYPKITQLEFSIFRRTYENENIYNRLTRLENRLFNRSFANVPLASRVDNILANVDTGVLNGISTRELAKLEQKVLGQTFNNDDSESRITRLEKEMLGAMQNGNITDRYNTIKTASRHYNSYPEIVRTQSAYSPSYYNKPYNQRNVNNGTGGVNGILQNILGAVFGNIGNPGTMTGYTPPIYDPYNSYGPSSGAGTQDYWTGNTGGHMYNRNIGSGGGIRILD